MRPTRFLFALAAGLAAPAAAVRAADPVTIELTATVAVGKSIVTVGDIALISGGDATVRDRVARTDVAELKARDSGVSVGRRAIEYRLILAGFEPGQIRMTGAERAAVTATRRTVTVEEVALAVRGELARQVPGADAAAIELAVPIAVKLPEVLANERLTITARPHGRLPATGRVQMDTTIFANGEPLLGFPVHLNLRATGAEPVVVPAGAVGARQPAGAPVDPNAILIQPRQRVEMLANGGGFKVTAIGEAQQAGRLGQTIPVQNVDSKRTVYARVTGPGTVEVDIGGTP